MMHPALDSTAGARYHSMESRVESHALENEIRTELLSFSSRSRRIQQLHKDIQQRRNKCAETLAAILTDPTADRPPAHRGRIGTMIRDFFSARTNGVRRTVRQINPIETKVDGEVDCLQMQIAGGDLSTPTMKMAVEKIDEEMSLLVELRTALVWEIYRAENRL
jgi:hypothetical protein